jgi:hypothetical protein
MSILQDSLRAGALIGLILLVGVAAYWVYLWPEGRWSGAVTRLAWTGWLVVATTTVTLVGVDAARSARGLPGAIATAEGTSLIGRLALLGLAAAWLHEASRTYGGPTYRGMSRPKSLTGGLVLLLLPLTFVQIGHGASGSWPIARAVLLSLRVDALTLWLGGLVAVGAVVLPRNDRGEVRAALPRFTVIASICAVAVVVTLALHAVLAPGGLLHSRPGALAAAKTGAVIALLVLGNRAVHRAGTEPAVTGTGRPEPVATGRLYLAARRELVLVLAIVLLAAALVVAPA